MAEEPQDVHARYQVTIDRLALELAQERKARRLAEQERDEALRRALRWRRVAEWIHAAAQRTEEDR